MVKSTKTKRTNTGRYVDGFVIPIPKKNLTSYFRMARLGRSLWLEYGALEYRECAGDDLNIKMGLPFSKLAKLKKGETVVFSWIVFKSKAHRDKVNANVMNDPRIAKMMEGKAMPFDMKRMTYGGFKMVVNE